MNQSVERANAISKIRKLQSQSVDRGCTESQVELAMRKISELLETFDLTMDEVSIAAEECKAITINSGSGKGSQIRMVLVALADFCDCLVHRVNILVNPEDKFGATTIGYKFYGFEQDVDMAQYLYELIESSLESELEIFKKTSIYKNYTGHRRSLSASFIDGFASRMSRRLKDIKKERFESQSAREEELKRDGFTVDEKPSLHQTGTSLIEVKSKKVQDDFKAKYGWKVTYGKRYSKGYSSYDGYNAGQKAASGVSLNRPIGNGGNHSGVRQIGHGG